MIRRLEARLLALLRVPPEPAPPAGAPGSLRVFRAGRNYMRLKLVAWTGAQLAALWGIFVSVYFVREVEYQLERDEQRSAEVQTDAPPPPSLIEVQPGVYVTPGRDEPSQDFAAGRVARDLVGGSARRHDLFHRVVERLVPQVVFDIAKRTPRQVFFWIKLGEAIGLVIFVVQFCWSLAAVWLDYSQRWYMVTDRSLRLRWGILKIQESTMSFANLQQVSVRQGPVQRLLRLADVEVQSAGGGSGGKPHQEADSMHRSTFHAVENATEIRDLIIRRLARFRQAGLGDPDDAHHGEHSASPAPALAASRAAPADEVATLAAAREVLAAAKALRQRLG